MYDKGMERPPHTSYAGDAGRPGEAAIMSCGLAAYQWLHIWPREPLTRSAQMHTTSCYVVDDGVSYASI